jgi:hypothetical protein
MFAGLPGGISYLKQVPFSGMRRSFMTTAIRTGIIAIGFLAAPILANPGAPLNWSFQNTTFNSADTVALGMRGGSAWPVIASNQPDSILSLFPTGWHQVGPTSAFSNAYVLRAANSPDGRVAFTGLEANGRIIAPNGAVSSLSSNVIAASFDNTGNLYTAQVSGGSNYSVTGAPAYTGQRMIDIDISPFGEIGVIDENYIYHQYSTATGWTLVESFMSYSVDTDSMDLEFDSFGRPHVLGLDGASIVAYDFDTTTGDWSETILANGIYRSSALAASEDGKVGTSWVDQFGNLQFSYKDDLAPWSTSFVTSNADSFNAVGVSYDYDNLPVIAYTHSNTGNLWLAYDPIIPAPEPASLSALLILSAGGLLRRRAR